jgi:hypothetical protein
MFGAYGPSDPTRRAPHTHLDPPTLPNRMPRLLAILLGVLCTAAHAAYDASPARPTDLSGRWILNASASDDPERMLAQRMEEERKRYEQRRRREESMRPPGEPAPIDIDPESNRPSPEGAATAQRRPVKRPWQLRRDENFRRMLAISDTLDIEQQGKRLQLVSKVDSRTFEAGSHSQVSMPEGQLADSDVGWDGEWFVIERKVRSGPRAIEKLRVVPKTGQLEYYMVWSGDTELAGMKIRRFFQRAAQGAATVDPAQGPSR